MTQYIKVRRSTENMIDTYHVGEAYPPGRVDKVTLWRTPDGYFGLITPKGGHSIPFENYPSWVSIKSDLVRCLREELECPEFERQLGPPFLDYTLVRLVNALGPVLKLAVARNSRTISKTPRGENACSGIISAF